MKAFYKNVSGAIGGLALEVTFWDTICSLQDRLPLVDGWSVALKRPLVADIRVAAF